LQRFKGRYGAEERAMSIWTKPMAAIDFADVDAFCRMGQEEGIRLDYKGEWPGDLAKTIAAFANTLGGMIMLGVDADTVTNKPVWPPAPIVPPRKGLPIEPGLAERVIQLARDNIYPPVLPDVSAVIPNGLLPGQAVVVIRVPQSREAPHAVERRRKVYVYDRTGNQNDPHQLADIDHIQYLLNRRQRLDSEREESLRKATDRSLSLLARSTMPLRWFSVTPFYPWRDLYTAEQCWTYHRNLLIEAMSETAFYWGQCQRVPSGSMSLGRLRWSNDAPRYPAAYIGMSTKGHLFAVEYCNECIEVI
jgi:Putative DNA-binding domain